MLRGAVQEKLAIPRRTRPWRESNGCGYVREVLELSRFSAHPQCTCVQLLGEEGLPTWEKEISRSGVASDAADQNERFAVRVVQRGHTGMEQVALRFGRDPIQEVTPVGKKLRKSMGLLAKARIQYRGLARNAALSVDLE